MKLTLGFSPCPNDTFIFDALVNGKLDTGDVTFEVILEDVETLNRLAMAKTLDITKLSYGVLPLVIKDYITLNSGSALGSGVGPLLIATKDIPRAEIDKCIIAIPGEHTTAHKLFTMAFPKALNKVFMKYNEIEDFVLDGPSSKKAGVIIHENRFTYMDKGLKKILDLGKYWEDETALPIPLGGIVAKRELVAPVAAKIDALIKQSIEYAYRNYPAVTEYVKLHSQEMDVEVMRKHIELYVNDFSFSLGDKGKEAILLLLNVSGIPDLAVPGPVFLPPVI